MALNVLLMLSSRQPPQPEMEIRHHAEACARGESPVYLATTRVLSELVQGESAVAAWADSGLKNRFLGVGRFEGYLPISSSRAADILKFHPLYSEAGVPSSIRGFVVLSEVRLPVEGETLDTFGSTVGGLLRAGDGTKKLSIANIPSGPARTAVYFWTKQTIVIKK